MPIRKTVMMQWGAAQVVDLKATFVDAGVMLYKDLWLCALTGCASNRVATHDSSFSAALAHIARHHWHELHKEEMARLRAQDKAKGVTVRGPKHPLAPAAQVVASSSSAATATAMSIFPTCGRRRRNMPTGWLR